MDPKNRIQINMEAVDEEIAKIDKRILKLSYAKRDHINGTHDLNKLDYAARRDFTGHPLKNFALKLLNGL